MGMECLIKKYYGRIKLQNKSASKATVTKEWIVVDADGHNLGRLAKVAMILRGKYKPSYTPHVDCGDNVIVINSEKSTLLVTKWTKRSTCVTGYPGGQEL
jgi:large subunit ribosomal protein L13